MINPVYCAMTTFLQLAVTGFLCVLSHVAELLMQLSSTTFLMNRHTHTHLQRTPVGTTLTENSIPYVTLQLLSPPLLLFLLIYLSFASVFRIFFLPKKGRLRPWNRTGVSKFLSSVSSLPTHFHSTCCIASFHFPLLRFLKQIESSAIDLGSSENSVGANMTNVSAGGGVSVRQCPMNFVGFESF